MNKPAVALAAAIPLALFVGIGVGAAGNPDPVVETNTVTKTVTAEPVVPPACAQALDEADRVVAAFDFIVDWTTNYLGAVSEFDIAQMDTLTAELNTSTDSGEFTGVKPAYESAAADCRSAS